MSATTKLDELVKEYLLYRSFNASLKVLESESKNDRDKGYRVDKIMENIHGFISNHELSNLREFWSFLDQHLFCRLEQNYSPSIRKLEVSLLKIYVINCLQSNRQDKVTEFFERLSSDLQGQPEWKEWFVLPFLKNPEENTIFQMYFTKQWQDTLFLSLNNFLSVVIHTMPAPTLMNYEEDQKTLMKLRDENEKYKEQLTALAEKSDASGVSVNPSVPRDILSPSGPGPSDVDLMDDFYVISQDTTLPEKPQQGRNARKPFFNFGLPASPGTNKKPIPQPSSSVPKTKPTVQVQPSKEVAATAVAAKEAREDGAANVKMRPKDMHNQNQNKVKRSSGPQAPQPSNRVKDETEGLKSRERKAEDRTSVENSSPGKDGPVENGPFLLMSQEEYAEHHSALTHCRFSKSGHMVATSDVDGVVKVWSLPSPVTTATIMSKAMLLSLEWVSNADRLLLLGSKAGSLRLFDIKDKKIIKETATDQTYPRIVSLSSSPSGTQFVSSASGRLRPPSGPDPTTPRPGTLAIWDINTFKLEKQFPLLPHPVAVNCTAYNRSGSMLVAGAADGMIRLYDVAKGECIGSWPAHQGEIYSVQFSPDENSLFSMGSDAKFIQWSVSQMGRKVANLDIHSGACGPFVLTGAGGYRQVQTAKGRLFAMEAGGKHVLTCSSGGGVIYSLNDDHTISRTMTLGGHKTPVVTVDWSATVDTKMCLTGSMDGKVRLSTLLTQ